VDLMERSAADAAAESSLVDAVLAGDEASFRSLYCEHATALYRLALRLSGGREAAAEDVVQECWSRALRLLPRFERRAPLARWLSGILVRCALERIRADRRAAEPLPDDVAGPAVRGAEERIDLTCLFERLPAGYRSVLVLHDLEGYTHADIAELLDISTGTSKSQLARARAWLRRGLGHDYTVE
jgi:RNA polymerase sigma-70 factor (ECF subfamily)